MIEIKRAEWHDQDYDMCCSTTEAVLNMHGIKIPLCDNCIKNLKMAIDEFLETYEIN